MYVCVWFDQDVYIFRQTCIYIYDIYIYIYICIYIYECISYKNIYTYIICKYHIGILYIILYVFINIYI